MSQLNQVGKHETSIYTSNGYTCIRYHSTEVVKFNHDKIILNSNGWETHTTKQRMNQASNQYGLGYQVFQKDYIWFVNYEGFTIQFYDGMELTRAIPYGLDGSISWGTLKIEDIIDSIEEWTKANNINDYILGSLFNEFFKLEDQTSEEAYYIYEDICNRIEQMIPEGFYFGSHPGDGSDVGIWSANNDY